MSNELVFVVDGCDSCFSLLARVWCKDYLVSRNYQRYFFSVVKIASKIKKKSISKPLNLNWFTDQQKSIKVHVTDAGHTTTAITSASNFHLVCVLVLPLLLPPPTFNTTHILYFWSPHIQSSTPPAHQHEERQSTTSTHWSPLYLWTIGKNKPFTHASILLHPRQNETSPWSIFLHSWITKQAPLHYRWTHILCGQSIGQCKAPSPSNSHPKVPRRRVVTSTTFTQRHDRRKHTNIDITSTCKNHCWTIPTTSAPHISRCCQRVQQPRVDIQTWPYATNVKNVVHVPLQHASQSIDTCVDWIWNHSKRCTDHDNKKSSKNQCKTIKTSQSGQKTSTIVHDVIHEWWGHNCYNWKHSSQ